MISARGHEVVKGGDRAAPKKPSHAGLPSMGSSRSKMQGGRGRERHQEVSQEQHREEQDV